MRNGTHPTGADLAHGVVVRASRRTDGWQVLLCRTDDGRWELPTELTRPGESRVAALARAVPEVTGQSVWVTPGPDDTGWLRCDLAARRPLQFSGRYGQLAWMPVADLPPTVPESTRRAIDQLTRDHHAAGSTDVIDAGR